MKHTGFKTTTVGTLRRELNDFDPRTRVYLDGDRLVIGKDFYLPIPTKVEREMAELCEDLHGVSRDK